MLDCHVALAQDSQMSLDYRSRPARRIVPCEPARFFGSQWPALMQATGQSAARAAARAALPALTFEIDGQRWTLVPESTTIRAVAGEMNSGLEVRLDSRAFSELIDDHKSTLGLSVAGRVEILRGEGSDFVAWDTALRAALDARTAYEPGTLRLELPSGRALNPSRRFRAGGDPMAMREFLEVAGFLCIEGVFTAQEMAGVSADLDAAVAAARPDDETSWWVRTASGERRPSRILNFLRQSNGLGPLVAEDRFLNLGAIAGVGHVHSDSFGEHFAEPSAEGLVKVLGVTEGISDLGWHKDCARGGHSRFCCGLTVGIAVTDADEESGELCVVAGSHRINLPPVGLASDVDLPVVALPTKTGDVTIHCSCTLHQARPPRTKERKVVYTGFGLPPRFKDDSPTDGATLARERADIGKKN